MPLNRDQQGMTCGCCFHMIPVEGRYADLVDQNSHSWKICSSCVMGMWAYNASKRALVVEEGAPDD